MTLYRPEGEVIAPLGSREGGREREHLQLRECTQGGQAVSPPAGVAALFPSRLYAGLGVEGTSGGGGGGDELRVEAEPGADGVQPRLRRGYVFQNSGRSWHSVPLLSVCPASVCVCV